MIKATKKFWQGLEQVIYVEPDYDFDSRSGYVPRIAVSIATGGTMFLTQKQWDELKKKGDEVMAAAVTELEKMKRQDGEA